MVAKITRPHGIKGPLIYNEKKAQKGHADCIHAGNFLKDLDKMNFQDKLGRFENLIALNSRAQKTNTLHISLNFAPSEKLEKEKLIEIAATYMENIGFGQQPYLVYQHYDAAHPHIHIVTTTIQADGRRIGIHNIGRNQSEKARKEIEIEFALVRASAKNKDLWQQVEPAVAQKAIYGKSATKRAITNILDTVIDKYKYTTLSELNAILRQYNVVADKGKKEGLIQKYKGLLYITLDADGNKVGMPIKASSIHNKPTLKYLEKKFEENEIKRQPDKQKLKTAIDWSLAKKPQGMKDFMVSMQKENVQVVLTQNGKEHLHSLSFIDHRTKSIFSGSDMGKEYIASMLLERGNKFSGEAEEMPEQKAISPERPYFKHNKELHKAQSFEKSAGFANEKNDVFGMLMRSETNEMRLPSQLLQKKRKKKRKPGF